MRRRVGLGWYDVWNVEDLGEVVDVDEGVVCCVRGTYGAADYRVDGCRRKELEHQSEYGRDDIGTEGLDVEIGNGAIGVGYGFELFDVSKLHMLFRCTHSTH